MQPGGPQPNHQAAVLYSVQKLSIAIAVGRNLTILFMNVDEFHLYPMHNIYIFYQRRHVGMIVCYPSSRVPEEGGSPEVTRSRFLLLFSWENSQDYKCQY